MYETVSAWPSPPLRKSYGPTWQHPNTEPSSIVREPVPIAKDEPLKLELQDFVECVREKQTPRVSGAAAKRALDLAFEITRQIQTAQQ